ncbi:MAG TPA: hypothetical protein VIL47_01380, partial [Candidatus Bipolaricaulota bacterium]
QLSLVKVEKLLGKNACCRFATATTPICFMAYLFAALRACNDQIESSLRIVSLYAHYNPYGQ